MTTIAATSLVLWISLGITWLLFNKALTKLNIKLNIMENTYRNE